MTGNSFRAGEPAAMAAAFAARMADVGPFESAPRLAVAVSGGADSMALCLLADTWARARGGRVTALTVDHGLRAGSAGEALQVENWLVPRGIEHHVLPWTGEKPASGLQAAARRARYDLMTAWCRDAGVLHLLLAHHREDQAETFLIRLGRGSGLDGLAGMAAVVETPAVRLVRPVLGMAAADLRATLAAARQEWIEDPSNRDPVYARTMARRALPELAAAGVTAEKIAAAQARLGRARVALEASASALLAGCCAVYPAGYARIDGAALAAAPSEVAMRALGRVLLGLGGRDYAPRPEKLERLYARLMGAGGTARGATLGGCRVVPVADDLLICRETRGMPAPVDARCGTEILWDRRFLLTLVAAPGGADGVARLGRLGRDGWAHVVADRPDLRKSAIPGPVRPALPALWDECGVFAVPHLGYKRGRGASPGIAFGRVAFRPPNSVGGTGFFLASPQTGTIS